MLIFRRVAAVILVFAAIGIWFGMAPRQESGSVDSAVAAVLAKADADNDDAQGAPQQAVVNGWATNDLLAIIARKQTKNDDRTAALLATLIVGLGLVLVSGMSSPEPRPVASPDKIPPIFTPPPRQPVGVRDCPSVPVLGQFGL